MEVENGVLVDWYVNPYKLFGIILIILPIILLLILLALPKATKYFGKIESKNIFYNRGCKLAVAGNPDDAMVLLKQAVESGYTNRDHALKDVDLESLREREDFNRLFEKS